jgi:hypothetical protein
MQNYFGEEMSGRTMQVKNKIENQECKKWVNRENDIQICKTLFFNEFFANDINHIKSLNFIVLGVAGNFLKNPLTFIKNYLMKISQNSLQDSIEISLFSVACEKLC